MSSETLTFETMDALEQAIAALRTRNRSEEQPQPSSVEITFGHSAEMAELSATTADTTEACSTELEETESEDEESEVPIFEGEMQIETPDVSDVEGVSQRITDKLLTALDELGGFATSSQVAEQAGVESNTASSYFSRLHSADVIERTEDTSTEGRRFIYILD